MPLGAWGIVISTMQGGAGNLPHELTSFVGRRREVAEVKRLLGASRMVTLTGVGGVGKTQLALRVASELRRALDDRVWLVDLAELRDPDLVPHAVASALGQPEQPGRSLVAVLTENLATWRLLLVLDNCEHLVEACAMLAETLLRTSPELRILATSRERLGIAGESALSVPALSVPDARRPTSRQEPSEYEAVNLFVDRAAMVVPGFGLTAGNEQALVEICHRVDGLPLAIELAAARVRALSVQQIAQRLSDRYRLPSTGVRGRPARQQTMRACVEWSYELCTPRERALWSRLAVFAGGFELDAAERICSGGDLPATDVLDLVASLLDKSILIREEHRAVVRFRLLETIRDFGRENLEQSDELALLRRRHRDYYLGLAEHAEAEKPQPAPPTIGSGIALTPRERQVADLVARGLTNRDIAAMLVIAQRTAETHVENILVKLGFTSRAQVAAWVAQPSKSDGNTR